MPPHRECGKRRPKVLVKNSSGFHGTQIITRGACLAITGRPPAGGRGGPPAQPRPCGHVADAAMGVFSSSGTPGFFPVYGCAPAACTGLGTRRRSTNTTGGMSNMAACRGLVMPAVSPREMFSFPRARASSCPSVPSFIPQAYAVLSSRLGEKDETNPPTPVSLLKGLRR